MKLKKTLWLSIACLLCLWAGQAQADPITIFNTGVDASGIVSLAVPDGTIGDLHYAYALVGGVPGGTTETLIRNSDGGAPIPPYLGDNGVSQWIGPNNDLLLTGPMGAYRYQTTFDLTGFVPATAVLEGQWMTDNDGVDIFINGVRVLNEFSLSFTTPDTSYSIGFSPFKVTSGFIAGVNTLEFVVNNSGDNSTALRVEVTGEATSVPEPASLLLLGSGLVGLAAWRRKHAA